MVAGVLEGAEYVNVSRTTQFETYGGESTVRHTRQSDERIPEVYLLSWKVADRPVIVALEYHFTTYGHGGEFTYTPPGGSEGYYIYDSPRLRYKMLNGETYEVDVAIRAVLTQDT
jgi:hypothetical protein